MSNFNSIGGRTILRFAHAFESGGGTERYLDDLDQALLHRNEMTIIRLHMTRSSSPVTQQRERVGRGFLLRLGLPTLPLPTGSRREKENAIYVRLRRTARDKLLYHPLIWRTIGARWLAGAKMQPKPGEAIGAGRAAAELIQKERVDLVVLHFFGGADADEVITATREAGVPVALLNHFSNDRFLHASIRKHAMLANGIAGVNGLNVPEYARKDFRNLSDGIDCDFYQRSLSKPLPDPPEQPIILLPARIIREKGQLDLVRAAASLRQSGTDCCVAFAGRIDASDFVDELSLEIERLQMRNRVRFLGDLRAEQLRDWYAASAVVAFPTYHHEGLGRVLIEAQAMGTPVVAYATGGVPEGLLPGKSGFLYKTGDIAALTRSLREILLSPALRSSMGACGRSLVTTSFSLDTLADRHERYYNEVIEATSARANTVPIG